MTMTVSTSANARQVSAEARLTYQDLGLLFRDKSDALFVIIETKTKSYSPAKIASSYIDEDYSPNWPLSLEPSATIVTIQNP